MKNATPKLRLDPEGNVAAAISVAFAYGADAIERQRAGVLGGDGEAVHQMRVAARRTRAAIELFAGQVHSTQAAILRRYVPWLVHTLGNVRECDVIKRTLKDREARVEPRIVEMLPPLYSELLSRRQLAAAALSDAFSSASYTGLTRRLNQPRIITSASMLSLGSTAATMLDPIARSLSRAGGKVDRNSPPTVVHHLRVRIKRMRYALEILEPLAGKRLRKTRERLEAMQDLFGSFNDTVTAISWLIAYADAEGAPPGAVMAAGAMAESLRRRQRKLFRRCNKAWRKFSRSESIKDTIAEIRRRGGATHVRAGSKPSTQAVEMPV